MSALYGWTSLGCSSPQGQVGPVVHRVEAKSYRSPGCPSRGLSGGGVLLGQGWVEVLECGPRGDPLPPHRSPGLAV